MQRQQSDISPIYAISLKSLNFENVTFVLSVSV